MRLEIQLELSMNYAEPCTNVKSLRASCFHARTHSLTISPNSLEAKGRGGGGGGGEVFGKSLFYSDRDDGKLSLLQLEL